MHRGTTVSPAIPSRFSPANLRRLSAFVQQELGIQMPESKLLMLQARLMPRVRQLGLASLDEYCSHLFSATGAPAERVHLFSAVTTNKTDFFREPQHFDFLTRSALPALEGLRRTCLNVWSAACSSGEEPYTLAMVLNEYATVQRGFAFHVLATDISAKVLAHARAGIYTKAQVAPVPPDLRRKYLLAGHGDRAGQMRVAPALRQTIGFLELNLMDSRYPIKQMFEMIFCRNVLIYFDRPTQKAVIEKLSRHLIPGGYLFIGHSESLSGLDIALDSVGPACYRRTRRSAIPGGCPE